MLRDVCVPEGKQWGIVENRCVPVGNEGLCEKFVIILVCASENLCDHEPRISLSHLDAYMNFRPDFSFREPWRAPRDDIIAK